MTVQRHSLAAMAAAYPPVAPDQADRAAIDLDNFELVTADDLGLAAFDPIRAVIDAPDGNDRSADVARCARDMVRDPRGYTDEQIVGVFMDPRNAISDHVLEQKHPLRAATRALAFARGQAAKDGGGEAGDRGAGSRAGDSYQGAPAPQATKEALLAALIDPADWEGLPIPPREYAVDGLIPLHIVAAMTGDGAVGKSLLMQGAATAMALGSAFLGRATRRCNAAYVTAEDAGRELWERQAAICASMRVTLSDLRGKLILASLLQLAEKALTRVGRDDRMAPTNLYDAMRDLIVDRELGFLVLDNAGHFYGGNEIIREQVVYFLGLLNKLADDTGCTIILISHPNKSGASYSGSTAWRNQVRLQLHLTKPEDAATDPNLRLLTLEKANYAPPGEPLRLIWHRGAMMLESAVPEGERSGFDTLKQRQDQLFMTCLEVATERQVNVAASKNAGNYAPKIFATMREGRDLTVKQLEECMARLFARKLIEVGELPFRSADRKRIDGVRRALRTEVDDEPM